MAKMFRAVIAGTPEDLLPVVYLSINKIAPEYMGMELGIGESILIKALAEACGSTASAIKEKYNNIGDLGIVAAQNRGKQKTISFGAKPKANTIRHVFKEFKSIAMASGSRSGDAKKGTIMKLLTGANENEARFIIASMQGKLRIGLAEQTVLVALSQAIALSGPEGLVTRSLRGDKLTKTLEAAESVIKASFSEKPSYDDMIPCLLERGATNLLDHCYLTPGIPNKPMLAKPTKGISEVDSNCDIPLIHNSQYKPHLHSNTHFSFYRFWIVSPTPTSSVSINTMAREHRSTCLKTVQSRSIPVT